MAETGSKISVYSYLTQFYLTNNHDLIKPFKSILILFLQALSKPAFAKDHRRKRSEESHSFSRLRYCTSFRIIEKNGFKIAFFHPERPQKSPKMAGRVPVGRKKAGPVPGNSEVPSHYNRLRTAWLRDTVESVPQSCHACLGVKIRLWQNLAFNINGLMIGQHPCAGTRYR